MVITTDYILKGRMRASSSLSGRIHSKEKIVAGHIQRGSSYDSYSGEYVVDPWFESKTLETKDRIMSDNVTINKIGVSKTPNEGGGFTVYIG